MSLQDGLGSGGGSNAEQDTEQRTPKETQKLRSSGIGGAAGISRAAALLREGGIVAFPTETVYGLGANAFDAVAVAKIFTAKQRPDWDPLIVHVADREMLMRVAEIAAEIAERVDALIAAFWPGPLTLLLPRADRIPGAVTAGRRLVGVRMPASSVAQELIRQAGVPVAAPSANRFGGISPTRAEHVLEDLDGRIDAILDGGPTNVGVESTVLDVARMTIYRPGAVTAAMIAKVTGCSVETYAAGPADGDVTAGHASPGLGLRHYAPAARLVLVAGQAELLAEIARHPASEIGVMLPDGWDAGGAAAVFRWGPWNDAAILARLLFAGLRLLDGRGVTTIVCPVPQMDGLGAALRDRLQKAARAE